MPDYDLNAIRARAAGQIIDAAMSDRATLLRLVDEQAARIEHAVPAEKNEALVRLSHVLTLAEARRDQWCVPSCGCLACDICRVLTGKLPWRAT